MQKNTEKKLHIYFKILKINYTVTVDNKGNIIEPSDMWCDFFKISFQFT